VTDVKKVTEIELDRREKKKNGKCARKKAREVSRRMNRGKREKGKKTSRIRRQ
jgi:hypothetical protein